MTPLPPVSVRPLDAVPSLPELLRRGRAPLCAWGPGGGVVGWGEALRCDGTSWAEVWAAWERLARVLGDGVRAVATFTFDPAATRWRSTLIVPRVALIAAGPRARLVGVGVDPELPPARPTAEWGAELDAGDGADYRDRVARAVTTIEAGRVQKVVVAGAASAPLPDAAEWGDVAAALARRYPTCWVYTVDGLVGASPELLLRLRGDELRSRVLAGTVDRAAAEPDALLADAMAPGGKNRREHAWAIDSALASLRPLCDEVSADAEPHPLVLPNVIHLASDVVGRVRDGVGLPEALAALHPTAAVCGTPTPAARELIRELEGLDRGRYAGPVGWVDAAGDGEFAIALRGGQASADRRSFTAFVGAGIVAGSTPDDEWREVSAKLRPIRDALAHPDA